LKVKDVIVLIPDLLYYEKVNSTVIIKINNLDDLFDQISVGIRFCNLI